MDQYAVFGNPISQSKSPIIHKAFAKETGQNLDYRAILSPIDEFADSLKAFFSDENAKGCNVTVPFKEQAAKWVDTLSDAAKIAGAVNTIIKMPDGSFHGDNTDGVGLVRDLRHSGVTLNRKRVLLIGAGGAARGVLAPLVAESPESLWIVNRTASKAEALADIASTKLVKGLSFDELEQHQQAFDVIINSTSASLSGEMPGIEERFIFSAKVVYDMVYLPHLTVFLKKASQAGLLNLDGLGMLVEQAAQSFFLWRGVMPETKTVYQQLRNTL